MSKNNAQKEPKLGLFARFLKFFGIKTGEDKQQSSKSSITAPQGFGETKKESPIFQEEQAEYEQTGPVYETPVPSREPSITFSESEYEQLEPMKEPVYEKVGPIYEDPIYAKGGSPIYEEIKEPSKENNGFYAVTGVTEGSSTSDDNYAAPNSSEKLFSVPLESGEEVVVVNNEGQEVKSRPLSPVSVGSSGYGSEEENSRPASPFRDAETSFYGITGISQENKGEKVYDMPSNRAPEKRAPEKNEEEVYDYANRPQLPPRPSETTQSSTLRRTPSWTERVSKAGNTNDGKGPIHNQH